MGINSGSVQIGSKENVISGLGVGTILDITLGNTQIKNFISNGITAKFDMPALHIGEQVGALNTTQAVVTGTAGTENVPCLILPPTGWSKRNISLTGDGTGTIFEGMSVMPPNGSVIVYPSIIDIAADGTLVTNQYDVDKVYLVRSGGVVEVVDITVGDGDGLYSFDFDVQSILGSQIPNGVGATMILLNTNGTYRVFTGAINGNSVQFIVGGISTISSHTVELILDTNPKIVAPRLEITPTKIY
jgi:hypothetical protein